MPEKRGNTSMDVRQCEFKNILDEVGFKNIKVQTFKTSYILTGINMD